MRILHTSFTLVLGLVSCSHGDPVERGATTPVRHTLTDRPTAHASRAFWARWGDGKAEVTGYAATLPRYGELWSAEIVLITVSETLDRRTLVKDDAVTGDARLPVLKLNASLRFQTGFYPYTVLTSVFMPPDSYAGEQFAPVKITLGAAEWCGHVYAGLFPHGTRFDFESRSYFASEGDYQTTVEARSPLLYEDALLVQLRELDGAFANGGDWDGRLVPSLWRNRRSHTDLAPVPARITRTEAGDTIRFRLVAGTYERTFEIENTGARRVLSWATNDGEQARLLASQRVRYWEAHGHGGEALRAGSGLDAAPLASPPPPEGTRRVGF